MSCEKFCEHIGIVAKENALNKKLVEIMEKALQDIANLKTPLRADVIARQTFKKIYKLKKYAEKHVI